MSVRTYILKVCRIRSKIIEAKKSGKDTSLCLDIVNRFVKHVNYYRNSPDRDLAKWMLKHREEVLFIIPENNARPSLVAQMESLFNQYINTYENKHSAADATCHAA